MKLDVNYSHSNSPTNLITYPTGFRYHDYNNVNNINTSANYNNNNNNNINTNNNTTIHSNEVIQLTHGNINNEIVFWNNKCGNNNNTSNNTNNNKKNVKILKGHSNAINSFQYIFNKDFVLLATCSDDSTIRLWNSNNNINNNNNNNNNINKKYEIITNKIHYLINNKLGTYHEKITEFE